MTWSETSAAIRPRAALTERARAEACRRVGQDGHSVAAVAAEFGVGWGTVMAAVRDYGTRWSTTRPGCRGARARGGRDRVPGRDRAQPHRVRDRDRRVTGRRGCSTWCPGRRETPCRHGFLAQPQPAGGTAVTVAALDPFRGYATALRTTPAARDPGAGRVPRHPARLRRRRPGPPPGAAGTDRAPRPQRRPAVPDPAGAAPRLRPPHRRSWDRLLTGLDAGDVDEQIAAAWIAAQDLRLLYRAQTGTAPSGGCYAGSPLRRAESPSCTGSPAPWTPGGRSCSPTSTPAVSNGPTEAINGLIKKIKRIGHGFRNFDNYRLRLLLHCGVDWHTPQPPRSEAGYHAWLRRAGMGVSLPPGLDDPDAHADLPPAAFVQLLRDVCLHYFPALAGRGASFVTRHARARGRASTTRG